jgi:16S rRNA G966 N2-methylase RsmD
MSPPTHEAFPSLRKQRLRVHLKLDSIARYSVTPCSASQLIAQLVQMHIGKQGFSVLDMFGGGGMDAITFLLSGAAPVHVIEKHAERAENLVGNIQAFVADGQARAQDVDVWNADSVAFLQDSEELAGSLGSYDVVYVDPPWGGPDYKKNRSIDIAVEGVKLSQLVHMLRTSPVARNMIVLKVPFNQNLSNEVYDLSTVYDVLRDGRVKPVFKLLILHKGVQFEAPRLLRMKNFLCLKTTPTPTRT